MTLEIVQSYLNEALASAQRACEADEIMNKQQAEEYYQHALSQMHCAMSFEQDPLHKYLYQKLMNRYQVRIQQLYKARAEPIVVPSESMEETSFEEMNHTDGMSEENSIGGNIQELAILEQSLSVNVSHLSWKDVAGLDQAIVALQEAMILPIKYPHFFTGKRVPWKSILLFGPPGTGKTHLASVLACEAKASFLSVSTSDVLSKWFGESEKMIRQIFELARRKKPCVLFFDEIDAICSVRNDHESETSRRIKTEFLVQMQGLKQDNSLDGVLVLAATNLPWDLDTAVLRRFQKRIMVPLPNAQARAQLIQHALHDMLHTLTEQDVLQIAEQMHGYSGSDIENVMQEAVMQPIRDIQACKTFKKQDQLWLPCNAQDADAISICLAELDSGHVATPAIEMKHVIDSMSRIRCTVSATQALAYEKFA